MGEYKSHVAEVFACTHTLKRVMNQYKIQGFCKVIASREIDEGISYLLQASGLGGMQHNTILMAWPDSWKRKETQKLFINTIRIAAASRLAIMVIKGIK